ncbi:MAG: hydroxymethylglutaryl-CoA reductase, degradative [Pseudomonadota bacterium]
MIIRSTAPGKLIVLGEYAVLEGAPALVLAVDRRARVRLETRDARPGELPAQVAAVIDAHLRAPERFRAVGHYREQAVQWRASSDALERRLGLVSTLLEALLPLATAKAQQNCRSFRISIESIEFFQENRGGHWRKLGLGSSAAVTVAAASALLELIGREPFGRDATGLAALLDMHRQFQGGRGSGVDLAASLFGGAVEYRLEKAGLEDDDPDPVVTPVAGAATLPAQLQLQPVWTGTSASTGEFLATLAAWRSTHRQEYAERMDTMAALARAGVDACRADDAPGFLGCVREYTQALAALGTASGLDIVSRDHADLQECADTTGVVYKPCGAGGGDLGLALSTDPAAMEKFRQLVRERGYQPLDLAVDPKGLEVETESNVQSSRIPEFYKLSVEDRVKKVREKGLLSKADYQALASGEHTLSIQNADKMIENVIGVMGLPVGLGLNFLINDREYVVPLVVEEPSIVAALSSSAKVVRAAGGFITESTDPILIGQIQVVGVPHPSKARAALLSNRDEVVNLANSLHPNMVARGGGARDLEVFIHPSPSGGNDMLVGHLLVDTRDAMGANLVNTMCEGVASLVENITGGKVFLRILSNLTDRAMVKAKAVIPVEQLAGKGFSGEQVRDGIILASEFAAVDPYRASTHNKGVMNGIDALALATGNDWRAIEAAAHAYAARGNRYTSLTHWNSNDNGDLVGSLEMPIKVGTVGGPLQSNPTVAVNLRLLGVRTARELAEVMGAVGLGQNFSALRALSTEGIQQGHMTLHARSCAHAAGAPPELFEAVVERLIESHQIKIWRAREIIAELSAQQAESAPTAPKEIVRNKRRSSTAAGHGKAILLGEHAVVYGRHAVAAPVPLAIEARVEDADEGVSLLIPRWGVEQRMHPDAAQPQSFHKPSGLILQKLGLTDRPMRIEVFPNVPRAMGLGGSAAVAVAIIRALNEHFGLGLSDAQVNDLAFESEKVAHGTPSGVDNTLATYGRFMLYRPGDPPVMKELTVSEPIPVVVGMTGVESLTAKMVARVRAAWERNPKRYERIFDEIDSLTLQGIRAIDDNDLDQLGELMNICQGFLNALQVSCWEVEELIQIARENGAVGAKLTGGGGGGSIIAICPEDSDRVVRAMQDAGYQAMEVKIG